MPTAIDPRNPFASENDHETPDKPKKVHNKLILCFDGTGNQYAGDTSDTNIVKIYQKFDRKAPGQYHCYQRKSDGEGNSRTLKALLCTHKFYPSRDRNLYGGYYPIGQHRCLGKIQALAVSNH